MTRLPGCVTAAVKAYMAAKRAAAENPDEALDPSYDQQAALQALLGGSLPAGLGRAP